MMNPEYEQNDSCVFCRIASGKAQADIVYQDDSAVAFWDKHPKAPVHVLIIPRRHIASVNEVRLEDEETIGHLYTVAKQVAAMQDLQEKGYRLLTNTGEEGGQTVFHLHVHLLGGKPLGSY